MRVATTPAAQGAPDPSIAAAPVLCACGCGQPTHLATRTRPGQGHVRGQPHSWLPGHRSRGRRKTAPVRSGSLGRPPNDSREAAIIEDIARRFDIEADALYERTRVHPVPTARQTAMWALVRIGLTSAAVARMLNLTHSTVLHGIARVEQDSEWQALARPALNLVGAGGQRQALAAWLDRGLPDSLAGNERRAVHAYATCALLGWERHPDVLCSAGMCLVCDQPRIRAALEEALRRCEQEAQIARIAWHATRLRRTG